MNIRSLRSRWATLALAVAAALAAAFAAIPAFGVADSHARHRHAHAPGATATTITPKMLAFHDAMRELWEAHGTYTERAIVDYVSGNPELKVVVARLLQVQTDTGNAVKPFYGAKAGNALAALLKTHINDAVATLVAAKAGNAAALKSASAAFYANGNQLAVFLNKANPKYWPLGAMKTMMRIHLNQVVGLAVDQIKGDYPAAIKLYDTYIDHLNVGMADMLSDGIMKQFPTRFR